MKKTLKICSIVLLVSLLCLMTSCWVTCALENYDSNNIKAYSDIELYKSDSYDDLSSKAVYQFTAERCKLYLPQSDFEYKNYIDGFYIFDGSGTNFRTSISFVLQLKLNDLTTYNQFLQYEYKRIDYAEGYIVHKNDYDCRITIDEKITAYKYAKDTPYMFGLLCENSKDLIVRYVFFRECEIDVDNSLSIVFENTNCEW